MKDEIDPKRVEEAAREGFGPQLVEKGRARALAEASGPPPAVAESVLGRFRAKAESPREAYEQAKALLAEGTMAPGDEKAKVGEIQMEGEGAVIDRIRVSPDSKKDRFIAAFGRLPIKAEISEDLTGRHPRGLRDGFYAKIHLRYDADSNGMPFTITGLEALQETGADLLQDFRKGRAAFSAGEWACFVVRSVGLDPFSAPFGEKGPNGVEGPNGEEGPKGEDRPNGRARAISHALLRLVPLVEPNYNLVELGPKGTGKSYLYQRAMPRPHHLSGGKVTAPKLFLDTRSGEPGLAASHEVVCFDEISTARFKGDEIVSNLRTYMESGKVRRGKDKMEGQASIVMLGNIDRPVEELLGESHLFAPFPDRLREDTALMDRIHAYLPGWEMPKIGTDSTTNGLGLTSSFLAECFSQLRAFSLKPKVERRAHLEGSLKGRDEEAVLRTASGLLKLTYPGLTGAGATEIERVPEEVLRWAVGMGLEARQRVRAQQHRLEPGEFPEGDFRFWIEACGSEGASTDGPAGEETSTTKPSPEPVLLPEEHTR